MSDNPSSQPTPSIPPTVVRVDGDDVDPRLAEILDQYFERMQSGETLAIDQFVAGYPDLSPELLAELRECLESMQLVQTSTSTSKPLSQLGDFRIIGEVGRGGMGVVYEAEQLSLKRRVALKVLRYAVADPEAMARFRREAETVAKLHHSNIVPIFAIGEADGVNYFAMQFIDGHSLADVQRDATQPLSAMDVADWGLQAAEALAYAHEHEIIHRDVKPSNLILDPEGRVWLTDFGLAKRLDDVKLSMTGAILGTPRYMSPEQASSVRKPVDHRTDIYSLGATLYELVTNEPLFDAQSPHVALGQIITEEPVPPGLIRPKLARDLETIIMRCLSKDAEHRYESATELVEDLRAFIDGRAIKARRPSWAEQLGRWLQKNQRLVTTAASAAAIAAALIVGASLALKNYRESKLGHFQFESLRDLSAPLVADILRDDGAPAVPSFTIPTQQPIDIPEGDYELQLHSAGTMSDSYRFSVTPRKLREEIRTNLEDLNAWPPARVEGPWATWERPDGADFVVFDKHGITLIDGTTSDEVWRADLRAYKKWFRDQGLPTTSWDWWNPNGNSLKMTENFAFGYARVVNKLIDCNDDGTSDLILAFRFRPGLFAISGADGTPLWCHVGKRESGNGRQIGCVWDSPLVANVDGDNVSDLVTGFAVEAESGRGTVAFLQAISGADGTSIWKYSVDPALHNTNRMPYSPYAARWFHEYDMDQPPTASRGRNSVWSYERNGVDESRNNGEGDWLPYGPVFDPNSSSSEVVVVAGKQRINLNVKTGELVSQTSLAETPVRSPQWIDCDGDGTSEVLVCTRLFPTNMAQSGIPLVDQPRLQVSLWDANFTKPIWRKDVVADWEWQINNDDVIRKVRRWPLLEDLDGDGKVEIILPGESTAGTSSWRTLPMGKLQALDLETGTVKWTSQSIVNMESQLSHFSAVSDIDGDGVRDVAVVSQHAGPEEGRSRKQPRLYVFVDVLSGKDGKQIRRTRSRPTEIEHAHRTAIKQVRWLDDKLMVETTRPNTFTGVRHQVLMFDLQNARLTSSTDRVRFPQLVDIDGDSVKEVVCWSPDDREAATSGGRLRAWRVHNKNNADWKYIDQQLFAIADIDGDGMDDALRIPKDPYARDIDMISGATGRHLWKHRYSSPGTIHVHPTQSDFDGDGVVDILVSRFCPQIKKNQPLSALSGRTGKKLWEYTTREPTSWHSSRLLDTFDLDGDNRDEILFLVQGATTQDNLPSSRGPLRIYCLGSNGRVRWQQDLGIPGNKGSTLMQLMRLKTLDVNQDGVLDLVGFTATHDSYWLRCQVWNGDDGKPMWSQDTGRLRGPGEAVISLSGTHDYPQLEAIASGKPRVFVASGRNDKATVRAIDGVTGDEVWAWSDKAWISRIGGYGEDRFYGNPVPVPFRTPSGTHVGFWYATNHPDPTNQSPPEQTSDFVLLHAEEGQELRRLEMYRQTDFGDEEFRWQRIWAADIDGDGYDEVVYLTPTHVVAYSLTESKPIWKFEVPDGNFHVVAIESRDSEVEVRVMLREGNHAKELLAIDATGKLAWSYRFSSTKASAAQLTWLDVLETREGEIGERVHVPRILCRTHKDNATSCHLATMHDASGHTPSTTTVSAQTSPTAQGQSSLTKELSRDPRHLRSLNVATLDSDIFSQMIRQILLATFIFIVPLLYLRHLLRGRWSLRSLFLLPAIVGLVILMTQWPDNENPSGMNTVGWNLTLAFTGLVGWVPIGVIAWTLLRAFSNRSWSTAFVIVGGVLVATWTSFAVIAGSSGYFQETMPVRYTTDGLWMCVFGGLQLFGTILCIGLIGGRALQRIPSLFTRRVGVVR